MSNKKTRLSEIMEINHSKTVGVAEVETFNGTEIGMGLLKEAVGELEGFAPTNYHNIEVDLFPRVGEDGKRSYALAMKPMDGDKAVLVAPRITSKGNPGCVESALEDKENAPEPITSDPRGEVKDHLEGLDGISVVQKDGVGLWVYPEPGSTNLQTGAITGESGWVANTIQSETGGIHIVPIEAIREGN